VACDLVCLILQAIGGSIAATANTKANGDMGAHIMIGGLGFQIFSLLMFMLLWVDFNLRMRKAKSMDAGSTEDEALELSEVKATFKFKAFKAGEFRLHEPILVLMGSKVSGLRPYVSFFAPSIAWLSFTMVLAAGLPTTSQHSWCSRVLSSL
jgi:RTA1 like protein